jgi:hypothetical protein
MKHDITEHPSVQFSARVLSLPEFFCLEETK